MLAEQGVAPGSLHLRKQGPASSRIAARVHRKMRASPAYRTEVMRTHLLPTFPGSLLPFRQS
jgi:hypothetical protein